MTSLFPNALAEAAVLAVIRLDIGVEYYRGSGPNKDTPQRIR